VFRPSVFVAIATAVQHRQRRICDECVEDIGEDYENCSVHHIKASTIKTLLISLEMLRFIIDCSICCPYFIVVIALIISSLFHQIFHTLVIKAIEVSLKKLLTHSFVNDITAR